MKRILKGNEPESLKNYRDEKPNARWERMKGEDKESYKDCRKNALKDQKGLCAYCEIKINANNDSEHLRCRIEHFHPKSDQSSDHNWGLDWHNIIVTCHGGSNRYDEEPGHYKPPTPENLSCDAYKNRMIQKNELEEICEGWIINPQDLPSFPSLFRLEESSGKLSPNESTCTQIEYPGNHHATTAELVKHTIDMLNLNCDRLTERRSLLINHINRLKAQERQKGMNRHQGLTNIARRYFSRDLWPEFFTTVYLCLGSTAESYLRSISYEG
ncbi:retron system putative HNH endonuclease [Magnetococcales bacterium HHB-1]